MEPSEIKIPLKVDNAQLIKLEIDDSPIKLKVKDDTTLIQLKVAKQNTISLKVGKEAPIKLKVSEERNTGGLPVYRGETIITPKPYESVQLNTSQKVLMDNIVVEEIPHYETSNTKGMTFIIGG